MRKTGRSSLPAAMLAVGTMVAVVGISGPATADDADTFYKMHQAIKAQELCKNNGREFPRETQLKLARAIDQEIGGALGAAQRLNLLIDAKHSVAKIRQVNNCSDSRLQDMLILFNQKLASAL